MRAILVIVVLVLVLAWVGWLSLSTPDGNPTLQVNTDKVKADSAVIVEKSKQAIDNVANKIDDSGEPQGATD